MRPKFAPHQWLVRQLVIDRRALAAFRVALGLTALAGVTLAVGYRPRLSAGIAFVPLVATLGLVLFFRRRSGTHLRATGPPLSKRCARGGRCHGQVPHRLGSQRRRTRWRCSVSSQLSFSTLSRSGSSPRRRGRRTESRTRAGTCSHQTPHWKRGRTRPRQPWSPETGVTRLPGSRSISLGHRKCPTGFRTRAGRSSSRQPVTNPAFDDPLQGICVPDGIEATTMLSNVWTYLS